MPRVPVVQLLPVGSRRAQAGRVQKTAPKQRMHAQAWRGAKKTALKQQQQQQQHQLTCRESEPQPSTVMVPPVMVAPARK